MKYGYYSGCCLNSTCKDFDVSIRSVFRVLGVEVEEIKNWVCCGSSAVHVAPRYLSVALPLDSMAKAQKQGLDEVLVPCAACYARFKTGLHDINADGGLKREVEQALKHTFTDKLRIISPLELLSAAETVDKIRKSRKTDLSGLKVVCYYGCYLSRVPDHFEDTEFPQSMDRLMDAAGAQLVDWGSRTDCCGGSLSVTRTDIARKLSNDILSAAKKAGAEAVVVSCPFCHMNLDARQGDIEAAYGIKYDMPVYYFSQVIGAALGAPEKDLMLNMHFVNPKRVVEKAGTYGH